MRITSTLRAAALLGLAVLAGLLGVGGTWALWNDTAASDAGAVQAADFRVELNGSLLTADGATVSATPEDPGAALTPDTPVYATVTVANGLDAGTPTALQATLGAPTVSRASVPALGTALTVGAAVAPASGGCAAATYTQDGASAPVAQGASTRFCLRMTLPPDASPALSGATATVTVPVTATQLPRGTRP
ncbi:hypothetical protein E7744_01220 [Citricoccus sp. SGAir0253]|uniref:SipW-dependent-type signal peptide-containing protein n=1 Tax=Citricoccus sp. SGAir0253 TaxID=2567881 RepID=UPI0010CCF5F1|nr:SipW-dependent-type signal peptide-containing protein [Citricoccus sp. SGAir0253]QCU76996.1 hypothetical protein E7744_01220 [Citricoccus sp. SGAir0253]